MAAGNEETSQAVTNALFGALGVLAAAQGTMNNLTFGDAKHQCYETICDGVEDLARTDKRYLAPGHVLEIETPGRRGIWRSGSSGCRRCQRRCGAGAGRCQLPHVIEDV